MATYSPKREDEIKELESLEETFKGLEQAATRWGFREEMLKIQRTLGCALDERYVKRARDAR